MEALSTEESDLHLMIFDLDGRLVYDYEEGSAGKFEKTFDLENLKGRDYNVVVSNTYFVESLKLTM